MEGGQRASDRIVALVRPVRVVSTFSGQPLVRLLSSEPQTEVLTAMK